MELNLDLAWKRLKQDHKNERVFAEFPYIINLIELDLDSWLKDISARLKTDSYVPKSAVSCIRPKSGWLIRPGCILDLQDEVAYNAIVGLFYNNIRQHCAESPDVAYPLRNSSDEIDWVKTGYIVWKNWREKCARKLSNNVQYVLFTDITGFYENIELSKLSSDLRGILSSHTGLELLSALLNRWSNSRGKGLPQGYSASHILAKLYLDPLDRGLKNAGFDHLRYVDDIRIFCKSKLESKRALLKLEELVRARGLNLQSAKTKIEPVDEAEKIIKSLGPLIDNLQKQFGSNLVGDEYLSLKDLKRLYEASPETIPVDILEQAFQDHFLGGSNEDFNKTLFHFLLHRLGKVSSRKPLQYSLELIVNRPEETEHILRYLTEIGPSPEDKSRLIEYADSVEAIYDYQLFEILRWFFERSEAPSDLIALCRRIAFDCNRQPWLQAYAILILGENGEASDFHEMEEFYNRPISEILKTEVVIALHKLEKSRRNSFYGRIERDGEFVRRAIKFARNMETAQKATSCKNQ